MRVDMHIHSTISDGSCTVAEIIDMAYDKQLDMIAITDHDTFAHLKHIPQNPKVEVIPAVEISTIDKETGVRADVLGYSVSNPEIIEESTLPVLLERHENSLKQIELLQGYGADISPDKLNKADGKYIYSPHILDYLAETKQDYGFPDFSIDYIDVNDAVNLIHMAGGFAVLAHPGRERNFYLAGKAPFDGIEYNHPSNSEFDKKIIEAYALKYNLLLTGGSDFHGKYNDSQVEIGDYLFPYFETVLLQLKGCIPSFNSRLDMQPYIQRFASLTFTS